MSNRREFAAAVGLGGLGLALSAGGARAQANWVEGTHYLRLSQPATVSAPAGKFEIVEFFSYGCPHCFAFEPILEEWVKGFPADQVFRRVPVVFNAGFASLAKLYLGLEAMGKVDAVHARIFTAIHVQRMRLDREADQVAFLNANGVDGARWAKVSQEFSAATKLRQAKALSEAYKIDGVPSIGIHGRYLTAGSMVGDNRRVPAVADMLIQRVRKGV
jgi:thiol:disulfide interchange protein DsbA